MRRCIFKDLLKGPKISAIHIPRQRQRQRRRNNEVYNRDLQLIANEGFQATTDLPLALYFEQILETYPSCKFILTKRENSQVWYKSWNKLTESITKPTHYGSFITGNSLKYYTRWLYSIINKDNRFLTAPLDELQELQNKTQSIISYEEHNTMVKQIIPPSQLLEYNVKQGWEPLCKFLEIKDCPLDVDFQNQIQLYHYKFKVCLQ